MDGAVLVPMGRGRAVSAHSVREVLSPEDGRGVAGTVGIESTRQTVSSREFMASSLVPDSEPHDP